MSCVVPLLVEIFANRHHHPHYLVCFCWYTDIITPTIWFVSVGIQTSSPPLFGLFLLVYRHHHPHYLVCFCWYTDIIAPTIWFVSVGIQTSFFLSGWIVFPLSGYMTQLSSVWEEKLKT